MIRPSPRARRTRSTAIVHSGGVQTIYSCVCGSSHTVATRNRGRTKHEREWMEAHKECVIEWVICCAPRIIHSDLDGLWAEVPAIPGCVSQGKTMADVVANIQEAIKGCLGSSERPEARS